MEPALHGSHRNTQHVGRLAIFHPLVVHEQDRALERLRQVVDRRTHPLTGLLVRHHVVGRLIPAREHLHQRPDVVVAIGSLIDAHHPVATIATLGVDGLVRGDGVEPGPKPTAVFEVLLLQIDL